MDILLSNLDSDKKLIDIRARYKYLINNIPGRTNVAENELLLNPDHYLDYNKEYVLYCDYGNRSKRVVNYLNSKGYKVYNLVGGFNSYLNK